MTVKKISKNLYPFELILTIYFIHFENKLLEIINLYLLYTDDLLGLISMSLLLYFLPPLDVCYIC